LRLLAGEPPPPPLALREYHILHAAMVCAALV
jgi:hypothetical protein